MKIDLYEVVKDTHGNLMRDTKSNVTITGVSTDTRKIEKGQLFVPLIGESFDGHQFLNQAIENGAVATLWNKTIPVPESITIPVILVEDTLKALQDLAYGYLNRIKPKVVAVTGSNGKTTTKDLINSILTTTYRVHKTSGNYNNHIGLPLTILSMPTDTEIAVLEMGMSNKGEIEQLTKIAEPDIAVITNIGESHIEYLKTRDHIAEAKLEIVKGLKKGGLLIANGDEPLLRQKVDKTNHFKIIWVGEGNENNSFPTDIKLEKLEKMVFTASNHEKYTLPLLGRHNVINSLLAIEVGKALNVNQINIKQGLENLKLTGMRLEKNWGKNGALILNDAYNASPTSMKASLELLVSFPSSTVKIAFLGDMLELGAKEVDYHLEMGRFCASLSLDYLFTTGRLGRYISEGAIEAGMDLNKVVHLDAEIDTENIANKIIQHMKKDTVLLVKASRGMRLEQIVDYLL